MKYLVLLCDGMADYKFEQLGGKTPMELANKPNMDFLAKTATEKTNRETDEEILRSK